MQKIIVGSVAAVVALVLGLGLTACSGAPEAPATGSSKSPDSKDNGRTTTGSSPTTPSSPSSSGAATSSSSSSSSSTGGTATPGTPSPTAPAGACAPSQGVDACNTCCEAKFPKGLAVQEKLGETFDTCVCAAGVCATQCAQSECSATGPDPVAGDACSTCMENATACNQADTTACDADVDCKALSDCMDACDP